MEAIEFKVLILSLYSGENEISACKRSVEQQSHPNVEHMIIADLPNKEAHDFLYAEIMKRSTQFDIFIKLDADMVLEDPDFVTDVVGFFIKDRNLDMLSFTVFDGLTHSRIWGINTFSNRCSWNLTSDKIFVDHKPLFLGHKNRIVDSKNMVSHCSAPSPYQAFMFGFHRALKVKQKDRVFPLLGHSLGHMRTIGKLKKAYKVTGSESSLFALHGVYAGLLESDSVIFDKNKLYEFYKEKKIPDKDILKKINIFLILKSIGLCRVVSTMPYYFVRRLLK